MLEKFGMANCKAITTPMNPNKKLQQNEDDGVDEITYRNLVGSLIYLTNIRPDIV